MQDCDVAVIGAGVAGLTAALHVARYGLKTVVVDQSGVGGQIINAEKIENFPGFPQGISGIELGPALQEQAEAAGADFMLDTVERIEVDGAHRIVHCASEALRARAVIVAAGSALRPLGIPGEERLKGMGVSHCASCDGPLFRGKPVCVIGGGDSAVDEALTLAPHAAHVTIVHRGEALSAKQALLAHLAAAKNIEVLLNATVEEIEGDSAVTGLRLKDKAGQSSTLEAKGVFVFVGLEPNTAFLRGVLKLDAAGHIDTDILMRSSVDGIFAAGDIRKHSVAQLASVAGDGATAAVSAFRYLKSAA
ncbi:MAG TPA: FAD-dependent oxidoreductase [Xanthobacteraceae bacterium]|nr:FAD-dependent oxidoreductase [Xanthobacteraceae bacterium]